MLKNSQIFVPNKSPQKKLVKKIIREAQNIINNVDLVQVMTKNPMEKMIPFNLWFYNSNYQIIDRYENKQHLRTRCYKNIMLTPLIEINNPTCSQIKSFLEILSLYQPFYPETFFSVWEFLQLKHLHPEDRDFLHIGTEHTLGTLESIIFYHEKYQDTYQYNRYYCWLTGDEKFYKLAELSNDKKENHTLLSHCTITRPKIDYLSQAYQIQFIENSSEMTKYNLISIDASHLFNDFFEWNTEENDLNASLFYLLSSLKHLKSKGSLLMKFNMIGSESWTYLFDIIHCFFKEYVFFRPSITTAFNSEIYLFANKYKCNSTYLNSFFNTILRNLYRYKVFDHLYLNLSGQSDNPIVKKYNEEVKNWTKTLLKVLKSFQQKPIPNDQKLLQEKEMITNWHTTNDLKQIKHLTNRFDPNKVIVHELKNVKEFKLKLCIPFRLYSHDNYHNLCRKRAELNYHKRIMDTKPSNVFMQYYDNQRYGDSDSNLISWEKVTSRADYFRNTKSILKQNQVELPTYAWVKMFEMLNYLPDLVPTHAKIYKTFHLCEAPGAFVSAFNYYLSKKNINQWEWYAQTLVQPKSVVNPIYDKQFLEKNDHFGLIAAHPDRWLFGDPTDQSGDISHSNIIRYYASHNLLKDIDLITADAGSSCKPNELNEQESVLAKVNMGQIVCILACLSVGKNAIFKTFLPMIEPLTISLMYLLSSLFDSVKLIKPTTSHSYNSEVYVVLQGYKGIKTHMLEMLFGLLNDPDITSKSLLFSAHNPSFLKDYTHAISKLIDRQIQSLCRNYYYYYHWDLIPETQKDSEEATINWSIKNQIPYPKNNLLNNPNHNGLNNKNFNKYV